MNKKRIYNQELVWYTKKDVLEIFPITERTYFRKLKLIRDVEFNTKENPHGKSTNLVHRNDLKRIFSVKRIPNNLTDKEVRRKYIGTTNWGIIGNIVPVTSTVYELVKKMEFVFCELKKLDKKLILFYSIEPNPKDKYFHAHFLMKTNLSINVIKEFLSLICDNNTPYEKRIFIEKYNYIDYHFSGSFYSYKTSTNDKGENSVHDDLLR